MDNTKNLKTRKKTQKTGTKKQKKKKRPRQNETKKVDAKEGAKPDDLSMEPKLFDCNALTTAPPLTETSH